MATGVHAALSLSSVILGLLVTASHLPGVNPTLGQLSCPARVLVEAEAGFGVPSRLSQKIVKSVYGA